MAKQETGVTKVMVGCKEVGSYQKVGVSSRAEGSQDPGELRGDGDMESRARFSWAWDRVGVWISGLCLVHCLLLPLALVWLASAGIGIGWNFEGHKWVHWGLTLAALPVGILALLPGFRRHKKVSVLVLGICGLALLVLSPVVSSRWGGEELSHLGGGVGALLLVTAHVLNGRYCDCGDCCHHALNSGSTGSVF